MIALGVVAGGGAGLLAGLVGIGGGVVIVPTIYYGLTATEYPQTMPPTWPSLHHWHQLCHRHLFRLPGICEPVMPICAS